MVRDFDAQIGIWGSIERVAGHEEDVYNLVIKCVDFSVRQATENDLPVQRSHQVGERNSAPLRQAIVGRPGSGEAPAGLPGADATAEENWKKNPNLVIGGDFQSGNNGVPTRLGTSCRAAARAAGQHWSAGSPKPAIRKTS